MTRRDGFRARRRAPLLAGVSLGLVGMMLAMTGGCMRQVQRNIEQTARTSAIIGTVAMGAKSPENVLVVAFADHDGNPRIFNYTHVTASGKYVLRVETGGAYDLVAFNDHNRNLRPDRDEAIGMLPDKVALPKVSGSVRADIDLGAAFPPPARFVSLLQGLDRIVRQALPVAIGEVADLAEVRFSAEYGEMGLWQPLDFVTEAGVGVFFLEPYAAEKIPVLFINGAGGSPQDWQRFFTTLDRHRYQPWFYFYPSGARLAQSAETLTAIVRNLHATYRFERLWVVAHSMGGLVGRGFVTQAAKEKHPPFIQGFISISTPWNGHSWARHGVERAPATIPSWIDMVPGSDYQRKLFSSRLDPQIASYLLFGYRGDSPLLSENNDGTVSLASQLALPAQQEARKVYGFNEGHTSILRSAAVVATVQELLDSTDGGP